MGERTVDARADIYALGAMTYEMLAGEPPFTGPTAQVIVARVMTERARPLRTVRDTVPESVEAAVATSLEKLPADRFASAALFSQALVAQNTVVTGFRTGATGTSTTALTSARRVAPIAALAALVGAAIGAAAIWQYRAPTTDAQPLPLHVEVAPPDSVSLRVLCCGQMFAISPNGRWLLFQGSPNADSIAGSPARDVFLHLRDLTELRTRRLPGTANATSMFFSPSGEEIGFVSNRQLWRLSLTGSEPQLIAAVPEGFVGGGSWSDDGDITLAVSGNMLRVSADGGTLTPLFVSDSGLQFGGPQRWSREQVLLYSSSSFTQAPRVYWRSMATGDTRVVANGATPMYVPAQRALLVVRGDGALMQYPFSLTTGDTTGPGVVLGNRIERRSPVLLHGEYAVSGTGTLVLVKRSESTSTRGLSFVNLRSDAAPIPTVAPVFSLFYFLQFAASDTRLLVTGVDASGEPSPYVFDVQRGALTRVSTDGSRLGAIGWAPGGDSIMYSVNSNQLMVRAIDGSGTSAVVLQLRDWQISGSLSAWGPWVAFSSQQGTQSRRIVVVHRDSTGGAPRAISAMSARESNPEISPDGKWLAFASEENGREEIFVTTFPTPSGRYLISLGGGSTPRWGRNAQMLYYEQGNQIMAVSFADGRPPTIGAPRLLYRRDPWGIAAVSSDGQVLVFADVAREGAPEALTVQLHAVRGR